MDAAFFSILRKPESWLCHKKFNMNKISDSNADKHSTPKKTEPTFAEEEVLHELKHYLPSQGPLKDFVHHNTLHAFQHLKFFEGTRRASAIFGYNTALSLEEYRSLYHAKKIREDILENLIRRKQEGSSEEWKEKLLYRKYDTSRLPRIGALRAGWKKYYGMDLDSRVHPLLFRTLCSYLDQGISIWNFPVWHKGFLHSIREMERNAFTSFFKTKRARRLLLEKNHSLVDLLRIVVGVPSLYKRYLFDQQFAHQGWSGLVAVIEDNPHSLLDTRKISLHELIHLELLMEIDALDYQFGENWEPLCEKLEYHPQELFDEVKERELDQVLMTWQEALEWSYYDQTLAGIRQQLEIKQESPAEKSFQAMFCLDDRSYSFRYYLEQADPACETFSTPGFFNVAFYYKSEHGKFYTKLCPAPITPTHLVKETGSRKRKKKEVHFTKHTHTLLGGWLISQTLGFWSAFRLFLNIFKPSVTPATANSFEHIDKGSRLTVENKNVHQRENDLQIGFTREEMADRVEGLLKSIGLVKDFAPIIYVVGHGASSVNNPYYAAYDCGACSGRPGSVNARVFCHMANNPSVRELLTGRGIQIPAETQFVSGIMDTTRDEITFYDEDILPDENLKRHLQNQHTFNKALMRNAKERSRRFALVDPKLPATKLHEKVKKRSVSLFEPRPEYNHATNAVCIVGRRHLTKNLFLDRRAFTNSYDYAIDPEGNYLFNILKGAAPVCGGMNLEYFFSRVDRQKLGAGSKLPHNVMGLFGVANGIDGDLRYGLPIQMTEIHDPLRLMIVVEHFPDVVLEIIRKSPETYEWFINEWIHLVAVDPETHEFHRFKDGIFTKYQPLKQRVDVITDLNMLIESHRENIPVCIIS